MRPRLFFAGFVVATILVSLFVPISIPHVYAQGLRIPGPGGVGASTGCSSPFTDNFTRANESPLAGNWTLTSGTFNLTSNNVTIPSTGAEAWATVNCFTFNADQSAQVTAGAPVSSPSVGVTVRSTGSGGSVGGYACYSYGTTLHLYAYVSGAQNDLASATITAIAEDDVTSLTVSDVLSTQHLLCSVNGVPKITYVDSSIHILTGQPGLFGYDSGKAKSFTASN